MILDIIEIVTPPELQKRLSLLALTKKKFIKKKLEIIHHPDKLQVCEKEFQEENLAAACKLASGDFLAFVVDWLGSHIQNTDMKLAHLFNYGEEKAKERSKAMLGWGVLFIFVSSI